MATKKNAGGRPRVLTPKKIEKALEMRDAGFTLEQIAFAIGVSKQSLYTTSEEWEQFRAQLNAIKWAKKRDEINDVKKALAKTSTGFKVRLKKERVMSDGSIIQYTEEQYVKPSPQAQEFYLTNNAPDEYKKTPDNAPPVNAHGAALKIIIDNGDESESHLHGGNNEKVY